MRKIPTTAPKITRITKARARILKRIVIVIAYCHGDGLLITGQNPASSGPAAKLLIESLNKTAK
jgi:hypothetical protein